MHACVFLLLGLLPVFDSICLNLLFLFVCISDDCFIHPNIPVTSLSVLTLTFKCDFEVFIYKSQPLFTKSLKRLSSQKRNPFFMFFFFLCRLWYFLRLKTANHSAALFSQTMMIGTCKETGLWIMGKDVKPMTFFEWNHSNSSPTLSKSWRTTWQNSFMFEELKVHSPCHGLFDRTLMNPFWILLYNKENFMIFFLSCNRFANG